MILLQFFVLLILGKASYGVPPPRHPPKHHVHPHIHPHIVPVHEHPPPPLPPIEYHDIFPQQFSFGVGAGGYHHEGAWLQDGKGESVWDRFTHTNPSAILDGSNGDESADSYNHIEEDVEILNNLTVRHYKFSLSWSRIIPEGHGEINKAAVRHYLRLLQLLKENQIEPIIDLFSGDLPQCLEDQGGLLSDQFPLWYVEYVRVAFELFGPYVKYWLTFNGPAEICNLGYGDGTFAPGVSDNPGVNDYICGHNVLKAHAEAYHLYDDVYRTAQKGKISIALHSPWFEPASDCQSDVDASEQRLQFQIGWFGHPIYIGDYPQVMIDRIGQLSEKQGLCESRLPRFTRKEIQWIRDTHDFYALCYFRTVTVKSVESCSSPSFSADSGAEITGPIVGDDTWGIKNIILWVKKQYMNPSIFIVTNGHLHCNRTLEDYEKIEFIKNTLTNIRSTMIDHDARVYGYTYYSYIDGFEWQFGYILKLGLYDVEFDCPSKTRTARRSAEYYQNVCKYGCINETCPPRHHHQYYLDH